MAFVICEIYFLAYYNMNQSVSFSHYYSSSDSSIVPYKVLLPFFLTIHFKQCNRYLKGFLKHLHSFLSLVYNFLLVKQHKYKARKVYNKTKTTEINYFSHFLWT